MGLSARNADNTKENKNMLLEKEVAIAGAGGIQALTFDEIEEVSGGIPLLVAGVIALYGTEIAYGAAAVVGFATVMYAAHN